MNSSHLSCYYDNLPGVRRKCIVYFIFLLLVLIIYIALWERQILALYQQVSIAICNSLATLFALYFLLLSITLKFLT